MSSMTIFATFALAIPKNESGPVMSVITPTLMDRPVEAVVIEFSPFHASRLFTESAHYTSCGPQSTHETVHRSDWLRYGLESRGAFRNRSCFSGIPRTERHYV